jgi:hypothetical protein
MLGGIHLSYTNEGENYRKYGIVIIESYDKTLDTQYMNTENQQLKKDKK